MDQDPPLIEDSEPSPPLEIPAVEEKKRRFSVNFSFRPRMGKKGLLTSAVSGTVVLGAFFLLFTALPFSLMTGHLAEQGLKVEGIDGSFIDGWKASSVEFGSERDTLVRFENVRFQMELWPLLSSQELLVSDLVIGNADIYFPNSPASANVMAASSPGSFRLLLQTPVRIHNASIESGIFHHPQGKAKIENASVQDLSVKPESRSIHWTAFQLNTDLGLVHIDGGDLTESDLNVQGMKAQIQPGLFPELLKIQADVQGHLRLVNEPPLGGSQAQLSLFSGKLSLRGDLGKLIFKVKDLDLPKNFVFDFPLTLEEGDVEVPFFSWNDPQAWRKNLAEQLPKMKVRFGATPLQYDASCDCLKDADFNLGFVFKESSDRSALGLKVIVNEYRPEPSFSSDEELLAETGWGKTLAFLSEAERNRIRKILPLVSVERPPELPETKENLLHDVRYLAQATKNPEILKTLDLIKKSAKESAPLPVLYFASLLASGNRDCEDVPAWLAEISAKSQDPMLLGKSFAVLSQCEDDPKKQKQLAEMAKMYLPKDPYIEALLHRIRVEHFRSKKSDSQALLYIKNKKTEKELSLLVIEGFLKREARLKSLAGTLKWAKEKYKVSQDDRDLDLVNRLQNLPVAKGRALPTGSTPRKPASKP